MTDLTPNEIAGMVDALRRLADSSTWQSDTYIKCDELDKARKLANEAFMFFTAANALEKAPVWMARVQHLERELAEARKQARREALEEAAKRVHAGAGEMAGAGYFHRDIITCALRRMAEEGK
jgi:hypothetical protein